MFSLIVLRFYVIVIILTYYITAFRLIIKIQASASYYLLYNFSISFFYILTSYIILITSPFLLTFYILFPLLSSF